MWLFYDRVNFFITLFLAELIICTKFRVRKYYVPKLIAGIGVCLLISYFWPELVHISQTYLLWVDALKFLLIFICTYVILLLCYEADLWSLAFVVTAGYCVQHISYQTFSIVDFASGILPNWAKVVTLFSICAVIYSLMYVTLIRRLKFGESVPINSRRLLLVAIIVVVIGVFVSFYGAVLSFRAGRPEVVEGILIVVCLFSILSCLLALTLLKALIDLRQGEKERAVLQHMLHQAKQQYNMSEENINIINIKCHDLKHQLLALGDRVDREQLNKIAEAVDIYDSSFETGNKALDVLLTEKSLICMKNHVRLTCMLDGSVLNYWKPGDIYSFFGNAIDNAFGSVSSLEDEKKVISITSETRGNLINIRIENYYSGEINFEDGLPVTSKDRRYHGFGMKSIKMVAEGYGCVVGVEIHGDIFCLSLFVPGKG